MSTLKQGLVTGALLLWTLQAQAQWRAGLELGALWADRNNVQIPNDASGDRFNISDLGKGPYASVRANLAWRPWENHEFELVLAPLAYEESGQFNEDIRFAGETYNSGDTTKVRYQFNNYRMRYLYKLQDTERWRVQLGATLFVRDAKIELQQGNTKSSDSNIGLVPLFALKTDYRFAPNWALVLDTDLTFAPQGRAIDLSLQVERNFDSGWKVGGGYRTIEGGADNDDVYTFAWFNALVFKVGYTFP